MCSRGDSRTLTGLLLRAKSQNGKKGDEVKPYLIAIIGLGSLARTTYDGQKDFLFASPPSSRKIRRLTELLLFGGRSKIPSDRD